MEKRISIRIEKDTLNRLKKYADYEKRSVNSQVLVIVREGIKEFEKENGKLE